MQSVLGQRINLWAFFLVVFKGKLQISQGDSVARSARGVECISYVLYYVSSWSQVYIFTLRLIFKQLMLCIFYFWIDFLLFSYAIGMTRFYLTNNKLLYLIYSKLSWNHYDYRLWGGFCYRKSTARIGQTEGTWMNGAVGTYRRPQMYVYH